MEKENNKKIGFEREKRVLLHMRSLPLKLTGWPHWMVCLDEYVAGCDYFMHREGLYPGSGACVS